MKKTKQMIGAQKRSVVPGGFKPSSPRPHEVLAMQEVREAADGWLQKRATTMTGNVRAR